MFSDSQLCPNTSPCVLDLLTLEPHTPTPEPVKYDKKDGQWYTHDGVDVKETQKRKGEYSVLHCKLPFGLKLCGMNEPASFF